MSKKKIVIKQVINSGLILEPPAVEDYHAEKLFGAVKKDFIGTSSPLKEPPIIFPEGIGWLQVAKDYGLPEIQFNRNFDTSSCFPYDTTVLMEDLSRKRISEIKVGDYVITHLGRKKKVTAVMKRNINEEVISLKISGLSQKIVCTKEHPFLTKRGWIKAKDLKKGDLICQIMLDNYYKDITSKTVERDKDFLWFLGMYIAEGCLGKKRKCKNDNPKLKVNGSGNGDGNIIFTLNRNEINIAERIVKIGKKLFDTNFKIYKPRSRPNTLTVYGYNYFLKELLKKHGSEYCDKKQLSTTMMLLEPELQMEIFKGWIEGDGYINISKKVINGVTTSKVLIEQFHLILLRNKIKSAIYKRKEYKNRKQSYSLVIHNTEINKIYPLGISGKSYGRTKYEYHDDKYWYRRIDKVETVKRYKKQTLKNVYNIEVEDDNSYIIDGNIVVHNCVIYSIAKALCYYLFKVYGIRTTVSEMYNAWYARVKPRYGTTIRRGMESFRKHGWVKDKYYPFTAKTTLEEYFREPPKKIQILAHKKLTEWNFHWEVIPKHLSAIFEAYKRTPVVLTGFAWASYYGEGIYYDYDNPPNHAFLGLQPSPRGNNLVDDTYPKNFKYISPEALTRDELIKELHKSYKYGSAHRCWLTPTEETKKTLLNFIINMFKKISRDIHGGFWFLKKVNGKVHKQKITDWVGMLGAIIDEVGVEKNNLTDEELAKIPDYQFFGK